MYISNDVEHPNYVIQRSRRLIASTMQDLLKNNRFLTFSKIFNFFSNLETVITLATEFSQTSRLHDLKLHAFISWETNSHLNPTIGSRALITFVPPIAQK